MYTNKQIYDDLHGTQDLLRDRYYNVFFKISREYKKRVPLAKAIGISVVTLRHFLASKKILIKPAMALNEFIEKYEKMGAQSDE